MRKTPPQHDKRMHTPPAHLDQPPKEEKPKEQEKPPESPPAPEPEKE